MVAAPMTAAADHLPGVHAGLGAALANAGWHWEAAGHPGFGRCAEANAALARAEWQEAARLARRLAQLCEELAARPLPQRLDLPGADTGPDR